MITNQNDRQNHPYNKWYRYSAAANIWKNVWVCQICHWRFCVKSNQSKLPCDSLPHACKHFRLNVQVNHIYGNHPNIRLFALNSVLAMIVFFFYIGKQFDSIDLRFFDKECSNLHRLNSDNISIQYTWNCCPVHNKDHNENHSIVIL